MEIDVAWVTRQYERMQLDQSIERILFLPGTDKVRVSVGNGLVFSVCAELDNKGNPFVVVYIDNPQQRPGA